MPPIGQIGTRVRVTPSEEVQIVYGVGDSIFVDDPSAFEMRVAGLLEQNGKIIAVYGEVVSGHERYRKQIATLLMRLDGSDWRRDNRSAAQFKVGKSIARQNGKHPFYHPEGTDIDGFPFLCRYGSLDSRIGGEIDVNCAHLPP